MKDSMGELNFTIIIIVAAGLILAFLVAFLPKIFDNIENKWEDNSQTYNYIIEKENI